MPRFNFSILAAAAIVAALLFGAATIALPAQQASADHVEPVLNPGGNGNPDCDDIEGDEDWLEFKIEGGNLEILNGLNEGESHTFAIPGTDAAVKITVESKKPGEDEILTFSWTTNAADTGATESLAIDAVIVKSSTDAYVYFYDPESLGDTDNSTPNTAGISHITFCYDVEPDVDEEELTVSKTVETSYDLEHFWDIAKKVETENDYIHNDLPKVWLFTDGSGNETATWTVDVTYEGSEETGHNVSGVITIENTGDLDATITNIEDVLAGSAITIDCGVGFTLPHVLPVGETLTCTYDEDVDGQIPGDNVVTVTTEVGEYDDTQPIVWGAPASVKNETVNVSDLSDLFGDQDLGSVTAPNGDSFTYTKDFAWENYGRDGCGDHVYDNTATIVETGQSADATLLVNVQCLIFQGETAWAANGDVPGQLRYTNRGNWATYVQYSAKTTTLFAGQTIDVGDVTFSAVSGGNVTITVQLTGDWEFADVASNLKVQGYNSAPSGNPAPGQFAGQANCDPNSDTCVIVVPATNYYGVHVDVGIWVPDPDFGP